MKLGTLVTAISLGGASLALACSASTTTVDDAPDSGSSSGTSGSHLPPGSSGDDGTSSGSSGSSGKGSSGSSGTSGTSGDGGTEGGASSSGGPTDTKLRAGETFLVGVTTGATPYAIYYVTNGTATDLEAVALSGGAPVVLQAAIADDDFAFVSGGAVAWFTGTEAGTSGKGKATAINVWTKANGKKTVTTATRSGLFAATDDGTYVAFGTASSDTKTDLVYTTSAAPVTTGAAFTGTNAMNWAAAMGTSPTCTPRVRFASNVLIAAYCTGTTATATAARLATVAAAATAATVRIDNTTAANAIQPLFVADDAGDKIFVLGPSSSNTGKVVLAGATTTVGTVEANITDAIVAKDGSQVVYTTTGGALKKATFAASPVITSIVATGVVSLLTTSPDRKYALYSTATDANDDNLSDAKLVDVTAAAPAPVVISAATTGGGYGFTGTGTAVVYVDAPDADTGLGTLKSVPIAGGAAKTLDTASLAGFAAETGNGIMSLEDLGADQETWTIKYIDAVTGGALQPVTTNMYDADNWSWVGKTFVYSDVSAAAEGVHAAAAP